MSSAAEDAIKEGSSAAESAALHTELETRCKAAGIEIKQVEAFEPGKFVPSLQMRAGRETRSVVVWRIPDLRRLLSIPFEKYTFIAGYNAICSYEEGTIEAGITPIGPGVFRPFEFLREVDHDEEKN